MFSDFFTKIRGAAVDQRYNQKMMELEMNVDVPALVL
jgi:hypothetical protein